LLDAFCENAQFESYLQYLLHLPLMFIVRKQQWYSVGGITFGQFLKKGWKNTQPTLEDFELHMSTVFPEARFRKYLEIRGADGQPVTLIPSVAAFWKGILYDETARKQVRELLKSWKRPDYFNAYLEGPSRGLKMEVKNRTLLEWARQLVGISKEGLRKQASFNTQEEDERVYLEALESELLKPARTSAEDLLQRWKTTFQHSPRKLIHHLAI
jgi:glutamate--cysteine ligase